MNETKSTDGLYFKYDNRSENDHLTELVHEKLLNETKQIEEQVEKKPLTEIFEYEDKCPGVNESFLQKLIEPFQKSKSSNKSLINDDDFIQVDERDIQSVVNENLDPQIRSKVEENSTKKSNEDLSLIDKVKTFIDELNEETEVFTGKIDQETFFNRRSRKAKLNVSSKSFSLDR